MPAWSDRSGGPLESAAFKRGPGGRPTREEAERRHAVLLDVARRLFLGNGLSATSVEAIAEQAGVAKRFIYARYADKDELFVAAIGRYLIQAISPLTNFEVPAVPVETGLFEFGRRMLGVALQPEPLSAFRTLALEGARFPNLARLFMERNRERAIGPILRVLQAYEQRGELALGDAQMMAEHFFILVVGVPQRFALIGMKEDPPDAERRLRAAIALFLDGCRARQDRPRAAS
ncbi:transcriptional regulator, TetR family [Rhizobiales bacterium GAS188]|nr:transcriptional regulator, TetR family [Rhizobiales bacterium GAS188]